MLKWGGRWGRVRERIRVQAGVWGRSGLKSPTVLALESTGGWVPAQGAGYQQQAAFDLLKQKTQTIVSYSFTGWETKRKAACWGTGGSGQGPSAAVKGRGD